MAEEFKGEFENLGENTENILAFQYQVKKEHDNNKRIT